MKPGDLCEVAIWLTGEETIQQIAHWKDEVLKQVALETEHAYNVTLSPWTLTFKKPGDERVPPVPDHVHGIDVRLMIAEAKVGPGRPVIHRESGFVADLDKEDRERLRKITRRIHARKHPGDRLTDRHCDQVIEALGPDVAVMTLRDGAAVH